MTAAVRVVFRVQPTAPIDVAPYQWKVTRSTAKRQPPGMLLRAFGLFRWKWQAILFARQNAKSVHRAGGRAQVVIHGKDGRIKTEWTYGDDPERSRG